MHISCLTFGPNRAQAGRWMADRGIDQDPFVMHGMVTADIHTVAPSLMAEGMAALLSAAHAQSATP